MGGKYINKLTYGNISFLKEGVQEWTEGRAKHIKRSTPLLCGEAENGRAGTIA